jgi:hypothetical protein
MTSKPNGGEGGRIKQQHNALALCADTAAPVSTHTA